MISSSAKKQLSYFCFPFLNISLLLFQYVFYFYLLFYAVYQVSFPYFRFTQILLRKQRFQCKFSLHLEKAGSACSRNILHKHLKPFYVGLVSAFVSFLFSILRRLDHQFWSNVNQQDYRPRLLPWTFNWSKVLFATAVGTVHGCHCPGEMALHMRETLAIPLAILLSRRFVITQRIG